jgi:excisionase family DNA binding protein
VIDINYPYDVLNTMFPGEFRREDRFKLNKLETPVYDLSQAAAYLRLSERQLRDLVRHRRITCSRIDYRTFRFRQADLDEFLEAFSVRRKGPYQLTFE